LVPPYLVYIVLIKSLPISCQFLYLSAILVFNRFTGNCWSFWTERNRTCTVRFRTIHVQIL